MKILAIQTKLFWEDRQANLDHLREKIAASGKVDLIILPEMFATGFSMNTSIAEDAETGRSIGWMKDLAKESGAAVCGSLMVKSGKSFYNRLYFTGQDVAEQYDKRHLFSLAEEQKHFTRGNSRLIITYNEWKIAPQICYDLRFPVWGRRTKSYDYDLLIYVANWPDRRNMAWKSLLRARAIENQAYVIGVNRVGSDGNGIVHSGESMVIDPMGKIVAGARPFKEECIYAELEKTHLYNVRTALPFYKDSDDFEIL